jgi:hypothetical protein
VVVGGVGGCANGFLETASVVDLGADFSLSGEQGGDGYGGFRRGSGGVKGGGGGGAGGGACGTRAMRALPDLDLTERRPDSPALEKAGGEAGAGDSVTPSDGVVSVDPGDAALERSRASTAAWTAAARVLCEVDDAPFDEPRGE